MHLLKTDHEDSSPNFKVGCGKALSGMGVEVGGGGPEFTKDFSDVER